MKKLSNIDESFWGDVHRRSRGDEIRKEDDINNYNLNAFYDYLNDHYWCNMAGHRIKKYPETSSIHIPFYNFKDSNKYGATVFYLMYNFNSGNIGINDYLITKSKFIHDPLAKKSDEHFNKILNDTFKIEHKGDYVYLYQKDGSSATNRFLLEVIDFFLENVEDPFKNVLVKKDVDESFWGDVHKRSRGDEMRREDIKPQDYKNWWRNILLDVVPKYKSSELRLYDFLYDLIIWPLEKVMNIEKPNVIRIYFKYEDAWYLSIYHNTSHGSDNYTMEANGVRHYNPIKYSEMSIGEKRSIKFRLEKKKFYVYKYSNEYVLREEPEFNGEKGVPLK